MAMSGTIKSGECEECGELNPYFSIVCGHCKARLPWADALESASEQAVSSPAAQPASPATSPAATGSSVTSTTRTTHPTGKIISPPRLADPPPSDIAMPSASTGAPQGFVQAAHPAICDPARVRVSARILDWPYSCACCGQSLEGPGAVGHKVISVSTSRSAVIPYCSTCASHVQLAVSGDNTFGCCVLLSVLGFLPLVALFHAVSRSVEFSLLSAVITCAALLITGYQDRQSKLATARALLNPGCCAVHHAVVPAFGMGATHSFIFKRREYAEAFIQANKPKVIS